MSYPWHHLQWERVDALVLSGRMPHALLFTGPRGLGKRQFARELGFGLVCENTQTARSCGQCAACRWSRAQTHPDLFWLAAPADKTEIVVDQIRELNQRLHLTGTGGRSKVAIIESAHQMNINAANALLKTLEEPPGHSVLMLVTDRPEQLLPTVRSRCQQMAFGIPDTQAALQWLQHEDATQQQWPAFLALAQGAPLRALELSTSEEGEQRLKMMNELLKLPQSKSNLLKLADQARDLSVDCVIDMIQALVLDLTRYQVDSDPVTQENPDFHRAILATAAGMDVALLMRWWDELNQQRRIYNTALNKRLFVENLFYQAQQVLRQTPSGIS